MNPEPTRLLLRLLDVGVEIRVCESGDRAASLLRACYEASLDDSPGHDLLRAELLEDDARFHTRVSDRPDHHETDVVAAVRALSHELLHAIMLRARELFYVHAGVVTVDEKAIVIPGLSRAGKSTLVLALLLSGARYLSDELLVFDPQKGRALPFLRSLKLRPVCLPSFPGAERLVVGEGEGTFLPSSRLRELGAPTPVEGDPARVGAVVIPSWASGAPTRLEPASRGKAFLALTSSALNFGTHRERSLSHLRSLVEDAECFHLSFSDPHDAARAVRKAVLAGDEDTGR